MIQGECNGRDGVHRVGCSLFGEVPAASVPEVEAFPRFGGRLYCWRVLSETLALLGFLYFTHWLALSFGPSRWFFLVQLPAWFVLRRWLKGSWFAFRERQAP